MHMLNEVSRFFKINFNPFWIFVLIYLIKITHLWKQITDYREYNIVWLQYIKNNCQILFMAFDDLSCKMGKNITF